MLSTTLFHIPHVAAERRMHAWLLRGFGRDETFHKEYIA
jgi:hypothetical protein